MNMWKERFSWYTAWADSIIIRILWNTVYRYDRKRTINQMALWHPSA